AVSRIAFTRCPVALHASSRLGHRGDHVHVGWNRAGRHITDPGVASRWPNAVADCRRLAQRVQYVVSGFSRTSEGGPAAVARPKGLRYEWPALSPEASARPR